MTDGSSLISALDGATVFGPKPDEITAVCHDSRDVAPGAAFVAVAGGQFDGHAFLRHARDQGAGLLVVQDDRRSYWEELRDTGVPLVSVPDTRQAVGAVAAAFYHHPARDLPVVGITGTNGKTTTTFLAAGVLAAGGLAPALLSTAGSAIGGVLTPNAHHLTTPDAVGVQRFLADARAAGAGCALIESTSHGLQQGRLAQAEFDLGVLTNLADDHLDYHGSREAYLLAKARLFEQLDTSHRKGMAKTAVLNHDDPAAEVMALRTGARRLSYGLVRTAGVEVTADRLVHDGWRTSFRLHAGGRSEPVQLALPGRFNVYNSLAAAAVGVAFGLGLGQIRRGLESVRQVPGRMQPIESGRGFTVVVDYAHNAHGLSQALGFLREVTRGRLIVVFGCAGDRDPGRRPAMGRVAARLADYAVVTSDSSWSEDPEQIMAQVAEGLVATGREGGRDYAMRADRREAITHAVAMARPGDTVLVAGMGHEQSMVVAGRAQPWDDRRALREILSGTPVMAAR
jgi:UDP-N-acetylmuramyl-tripeptide synthetase